jgi:hypothetical protein
MVLAGCQNKMSFSAILMAENDIRQAHEMSESAKKPLTMNIVALPQVH